MRRSSLTLHFTSLAASITLILSAITNFIFTVLWQHPTGAISSTHRTTQGRCQFDFDIFWTGTGGSCYPGIGWGFLLTGAILRMVLTTIILITMHLAIWMWTHTGRETITPRGVYASVNNEHSPSDVAMKTSNWEAEKKSGRPQPLNLGASSHHNRNLSGDSTITSETVSSGERSPTPTAEQLKDWAVHYHSSLLQSDDKSEDELSSMQFAASDTPSPRIDEFDDHTSAHVNPSIRLGRIPGIVHRLSTIESASEGGISRASTFGRKTPSASGHISITGWTNEFGVTREGSRGTAGTNTSSSSEAGIRRMDSFVSAFSSLQSSSSSPTSPLNPCLPERASTSDSLGSSSVRTEYYNALTDIEEPES